MFSLMYLSSITVVVSSAPRVYIRKQAISRTSKLVFFRKLDHDGRNFWSPAGVDHGGVDGIVNNEGVAAEYKAGDQ